MPGPTPRCLLDRSRPCGGCVAVGPHECPYAYLLGDEVTSSGGRPGTGGADGPPRATTAVGQQ